jgi:hypothetical protein
MPEGSSVRKLIGAFVAILALLAAAPGASAGTVGFGFGDDASVEAFPDSPARAASAGMSYARFFIAWSGVATERPLEPRNPNDPAYDWSAVDRQLAPYAAAGLDVMAQLWMVPGWANGGQAPSHYALHSDDFGDFAYAAALRYPQIRWWLPVNEPNLPAAVQPTSVVMYERMLRTAYDGIKEADPAAQVVAGPLAHTLGKPDLDAWQWATQLVRDNAPMDAFAVNPYPGWADPISARSAWRFDIWDLPELWRVVGVPVIVAEFGWSTQLVSEANQASWLGDAIRVARCTPGLMRFTLWGFRDHAFNASAPTALEDWGYFGLLRADGTPKPALASFARALTAQLDCAEVGRAAGAPPGWTPLVQANEVALTSPLVLPGLLALAAGDSGLPDAASLGSGTASPSASADVKQVRAAAHSSMRPRLIRLGRTRGKWWVSVRTSTAARIRVAVDRLAAPRALLVRRIAAPARARVGARRIVIGPLRAGARFRVRVLFTPVRGSAVALARTFRSPG